MTLEPMNRFLFTVDAGVCVYERVLDKPTK